MIYELDETMQTLQDSLIEEDFLDDFTFEIDLEKKVDDYVKIMRNLQTDADAYGEEIKRLQAKKKQAEAGIERFKEFLKMQLLKSKQRKVKGTLFSVSLRANAPQLPKGLELTDIPDEYLIPQEPKVDRRQLLNDVKKGIVKGIELEQSQSVQIK